MTQEEKQRLFKVLCTMLPYGVVVHTDYKDIRLDKNHCNIGMLYYEDYSDGAKKECGYDENDCSIIISGCYYGDVKPYLRPMSSMTEEEAFRYNHLDLLNYSNDGFEMPNFRSIDWLNAHHFDYRGLIEKGLALEAPEGMYKIK